MADDVANALDGRSVVETSFMMPLNPKDRALVRDSNIHRRRHSRDHTSMPDAHGTPSTESLPRGDETATTATTDAAAAEFPVRVEALRKSFGRNRVLKDLTLAFPRGKTTVVLGPSGCGKSVLLKHLIGLLHPERGQVYFENERIDTLSERRLAHVRQQIGFLFQQGALFDSMNVYENVAFPLRQIEGRSPYDEETRVRRVLRLVGLENTLLQQPSELSGGQQKRVALARAVVLEPSVVLYDEPTTGLDPIRSDVINELILKLKQELHVTSIVVTHDLISAFKVADHMVMLHEGRVVLAGAPAEFRASTDPIVSRFLRGEASDEELRAIREVSAVNRESARGPAR